MMDGPYQSTATLNEQTVDMNVYFAKKKPQKQKNNSLFKFESSSHPTTLNSYLKEHRYSSFALTVTKNSKTKL